MALRDEITKEDLKELSATIEKRLDGLDTKLDLLRTATIPEIEKQVALSHAHHKWNGSVFGFIAGVTGAVVVAVILSFLNLPHGSGQERQNDNHQESAASE